MNPQRATVEWKFWASEEPPIKDNFLQNIDIHISCRLTKIGTTTDDNTGIWKS